MNAMTRLMPTVFVKTVFAVMKTVPLNVLVHTGTSPLMTVRTVTTPELVSAIWIQPHVSRKIHSTKKFQSPPVAANVVSMSAPGCTKGPVPLVHKRAQESFTNFARAAVAPLLTEVKFRIIWFSYNCGHFL